MFLVKNSLESYHNETVSDPKRAPSVRTLWQRQRLAVHGYNVGRRFADDAPGDVLLDRVLFYRHHRYGGVGGQPVRFVVPAGIVADVIHVAEDKRHCRELPHAGTGDAQVLGMRLLIALDVE